MLRRQLISIKGVVCNNKICEYKHDCRFCLYQQSVSAVPAPDTFFPESHCSTVRPWARFLPIISLIHLHKKCVDIELIADAIIDVLDDGPQSMIVEGPCYRKSGTLQFTMTFCKRIMERKLSAQQSERDFDKRQVTGDMTKLCVAQITSRPFSHRCCIPWRIVYLLPVSVDPCHFRCPFRRSEEVLVPRRILTVFEVLNKMFYTFS